MDTQASTASARTKRFARVRKFLRLSLLLLMTLLAGALGMRAWMLRDAPDLKAWHTTVPADLEAATLDQIDWTEYLRAEQHLFEQVAQQMQRGIDTEDHLQFNRYYAGSRVHPGKFTTDWNRSYVLSPAGAPLGVVVLLHGMTDSPYSLRHIAELYRKRGFVALGLRLPAHGTVPGALTRIEWEDWMAAVRLAMREAARLTAGKQPVHIVGYSNGGALALKYTLDSLEDDRLLRPDRIVLLSPMIGISESARYAGVAGWLAVLPAFAKAAWLDNLPEFNPFKYNSFPVNAARQSYLLTRALNRQILRLEQSGSLAALPPILTFQSVVDATVRTDAVATVLYANLPANGSELDLFDINRDVDFSRMLRAGALLTPATMLAPAPRTYRLAVITNAGPRSREVVAQITEAGERAATTQPLNLAYPQDVFSLSHIALPFPITDGLYGMTPDPREDFGIRLGTLGLRGERGVLAAGLDSTTVRISSNPLFSYVAQRIEAGIPESSASTAQR